jgi:hypothetical protein
MVTIPSSNTYEPRSTRARASGGTYGCDSALPPPRPRRNPRFHPRFPARALKAGILYQLNQKMHGPEDLDTLIKKYVSSTLLEFLNRTLKPY